ncbi:hypothetical protein H2204_002810 [Knufia peltigerae]|uniref:Xylanolytic transcriptional activator regulatory domain-containing protein n=1 Tax=Knufia peltigerae TaxID=1002370 RepID=A0AA39D116_9EURO|nr:hypothetical protein H2204_002810 [Knufia peltigerae]
MDGGSAPAIQFEDLQAPNQIPHYQVEDLSVDIFDDYDWSTMFQDESFADLGPSSLADIAHSFHYPLATTSGVPDQQTVPASPLTQQKQRGLIINTEATDLSAFASRLPSLEPEEVHQSDSMPLLRSSDQTGGQAHSSSSSSSWTAQNPRRCFLEVTHECRQRVLNDLFSDFTNFVPDDFVLPSKHALNRFVAIYIASFYEHNPVLHLPTMSLNNTSVELCLAIAAVGAHYCGEVDTSTKLYRVAKDVAFERMDRLADSAISNAPQERDGAQQSRLVFQQGEWPTQKDFVSQAQIELMQTFVILFGFSLWFPKTPGPALRSKALLQCILESLIRDVALDAAKEATIQRNHDWQSWVQAETLKRIVLVSFCLFNLQTLIHETPPPLLWSEIDMCLPCSEGRWNATSPTAWASSVEQQDLGKAMVQETLQNLFNEEGSGVPHPNFSSLGGYFLIHAILQHMWILQKTRLLQSKPLEERSREQEAVTFGQFQRALRQWRRGWTNDRESSMSPVNPCGPIAFTSTALLRLAYVRLSFSARLIPLLINTWSAEKIARAFIQAPSAERNDRTTRAALHCAHALSIPVKIGLKFVARTQGFYWSNQHAVSSLECALFLCKWLQSVTSPEDADTNVSTITEQEMLVIDFIIAIVAETDLRASKEVLLQTRNLLSRTVVSIWSRLFPGDSAWKIVDLIGSSMRACIDALDCNAGMLGN